MIEDEYFYCLMKVYKINKYLNIRKGNRVHFGSQVYLKVQDLDGNKKFTKQKIVEYYLHLMMIDLFDHDKNPDVNLRLIKEMLKYSDYIDRSEVNYIFKNTIIIPEVKMSDLTFNINYQLHIVESMNHSWYFEKGKLYPPRSKGKFELYTLHGPLYNESKVFFKTFCETITESKNE